MRWSFVLCLPLLGIGGLATAETDEPCHASAAGVPVAAWPPPQQPPIPLSTAVRIDHLREAAKHLQAAGLNSLADHIRGLSNTPTAGEPPRDTQTILLKVKVLELDHDTLRDLGWDYSKTPLLREPQALNRLLAALRVDGQIRVLGEPTMATVIGRPAILEFGDEVPIWEISEDGKLVQRYKCCGTYANLLPRLANGLQLLLDVRLEVSKVDRSRTVLVGGKENPLICQKTVSTPLEMKFGETFAMSFPSLADTGKVTDSASVVVVILVTPEAVAPMAAM